MSTIYTALPLQTGEILIAKRQGSLVLPQRVVYGAMSVAAHVLDRRPRDIPAVLAELGTSLYALKGRWVTLRRRHRQELGKHARLKYESFEQALRRLA